MKNGTKSPNKIERKLAFGMLSFVSRIINAYMHSILE